MKIVYRDMVKMKYVKAAQKTLCLEEKRKCSLCPWNRKSTSKSIETLEDYLSRMKIYTSAWNETAIPKWTMM